jgi:hypothetical protein
LGDLDARRAKPRRRVAVAIIAIGANAFDQADLGGKICDDAARYGFVLPAGWAFKRNVRFDVEWHFVLRYYILVDGVSMLLLLR